MGGESFTGYLTNLNDYCFRLSAVYGMMRYSSGNVIYPFSTSPFTVYEHIADFFKTAQQVEMGDNSAVKTYNATYRMMLENALDFEDFYMQVGHRIEDMLIE